MMTYIWLHVELAALKLQGWWIARELAATDKELAKWERIAAKAK